MPLNLQHLIGQFLEWAGKDEEFEFYNEAGLQHELGFFLRKKLRTKGYRVQLERNVSVVPGCTRKTFAKKEMDIYVSKKSNNDRHCIELKFPRKGAYPRRMFQSFEDVKFLEELRLHAGFAATAFLFLTDLRGFRDGPKKDGIYQCFRATSAIRTLKISEMPEFLRRGKSRHSLLMRHTYGFEWQELEDRHGITYYYFVI